MFRLSGSVQKQLLFSWLSWEFTIRPLCRKSRRQQKQNYMNTSWEMDIKSNNSKMIPTSLIFFVFGQFWPDLLSVFHRFFSSLKTKSNSCFLIFFREMAIGTITMAPICTAMEQIKLDKMAKSTIHRVQAAKGGLNLLYCLSKKNATSGQRAKIFFFQLGLSS